MTRTMRAFAIVMLAGLVAAPQRPAAQATADVELRAAMETETVKGDLNAAIKQYQAVVDKYHKIDRAVAATALLRMAECHQKMGNPDARAAYERILTDFASEKNVALVARQRLNASNGAGGGPLSTRLVSGHYSLWDLVTPDGRFSARTDWDSGDLVIRDLVTKVDRRLVPGSMATPGAQSWAEGGAFSPDRRQVAYSWFFERGNQLRLIGLDQGAKPTIVFDRYPEFRNINVIAWSPVAPAILVTVMKPAPDNSMQLAWVSTADGSIRVLKSFDRWRTTYGNSLGPVSLSPDGRFIAYSTRAREGSTEQRVFVLAANGSSETTLSDHAGISRSPIWTPDGARILFVNDWTGTFGLSSVIMRDGRPVGEPSVVKADVGGIQPIGVTTSGSVYYNYRYGAESHAFVAALDSPSKSAYNGIVSDFSGGYASWAPDGSAVAFVRTRGASIRELVVRDAKTGAEKVFNQRPIVNRAPIWLRHRRAVLVGTPPDVPRTSPSRFIVDLETGRVSAVGGPPSPRYTLNHFGALSLDDKTLYAAADDQTTNSVSFDDIVALDLASGEQRRIATLPPGGTARGVGTSVQLSLSPDGTTLAVLSRSGDRDANRPTLNGASLYTIDVRDGSLRQIHKDFKNATDAKVTWSKDGKSIYFVEYGTADGGLSSDWRVMRIAREGGAPVATSLSRATLQSSFRTGQVSGSLDEFVERLNVTLQHIDLSPDGTRLLFSAGLNPKYEVWALDNFLPVGPSRKQ
jgi:Tol biopolymer transport system component